MEERLSAIASVEPSSSMGTDAEKHPSTPKTDSLATLLTQGLLSNDKKMLNVGIACAVYSKVMVKASHTHYRALGPELIWCTGSQPADRLPLLSARPAVAFPAAEHHRRPLAGTKLYCLAHRREQLAAEVATQLGSE